MPDWFGLIYIKKKYAIHHSSNTDDLDSIYPTQDEIIKVKNKGTLNDF
jgi:hypothetical protein